MLSQSFFTNFGQGPFPEIAGKGPDFRSNFDQVCSKLHGLIRACVSESLAFNVANPFKVLFKYFTKLTF